MTNIEEKDAKNIEALRATALRNLYIHFNDPFYKVEYDEKGHIVTLKDNIGVIAIFDIDDFLVNSADAQQEQLDKYEPANGVRLKTNFMRMLEQLRRNCEYLKDKVREECKKAQTEKRNPNFSHLPAFKNYRRGNGQNKYTAPIDFADAYCMAARELYRQFFEERNTFLEIDNKRRGEGLEMTDERIVKEYARRENIKNIVKANGRAFKEINEFCLGEIKHIIEDAKTRNRREKIKDFIMTHGDEAFKDIDAISLDEMEHIIDEIESQQENHSQGNKKVRLTRPDFGKLFSIDVNDVLKKNSMDNVDEDVDEEYVLYTKPIEILQNCVDQQEGLITQDWDLNVIVNNFKIFLMKSEEYIDFADIYSMKNVNKPALNYILDLIYSGKLVAAFAHSHYTGIREGYYKLKLIMELLPILNGVIFQRFLAIDHDAALDLDIYIRERDVKIAHSCETLGVDAKVLALNDDSRDNIEPARLLNAITCWFKKVTDSEKINGELEDTSADRITKFDKEAVQKMLGVIHQRTEQLVEEFNRLEREKAEYEKSQYEKA